MRLSIRGKLFLTHLLAMLLVSGSVGSYFYWTAVQNLTKNIQARLERTAALTGQILDAKELDSIRSAEDRDQPVYTHYLTLLRNLRATNPDIAFLYIMRLDGGRIFFLIDSDESDEQASPGLEYVERMLIARCATCQPFDECVKAADSALYRAKLQGRNRVVAAPRSDSAAKAAA